MLISGLRAYSQHDTVDLPLPDSTFLQSNQDDDDLAAPDSTSVNARNFDSSTVDRLKNDSELKYQEVPTVAESLWTRFLAWLADFIESFFDKAVNTSWGRILTYGAAVIIIVVLIMTFLKVNAFKVFYSGEGAESFKHTVLDENIHEMDFDKLIQEALARQDYRLGVRLIFLYSLKMLADKNLIHWDQGKTNHDYLSELKVAELKNGFHELNFYFEYAWYGNFDISPNMFSHVQLMFNDWKNRIR